MAAKSKWAEIRTNFFDEEERCVYVEEAEYVSEDNLKKGISLYRRHIWSAAFHGYSSVEKENVDSLIDDAKCRINGQVISRDLDREGR